MKSKNIIISLVVLSLLIIPTIFAQQLYYEGYKIKPRNLVKNGDFDDGFDKWDVTSNWQLYSPNNQVHYDSTRYSRNGYLQQDVKTKVGRTYLLEVDLAGTRSRNVILDISLGGQSYSGAIVDLDQVGTEKFIFTVENDEPLRFYAYSSGWRMTWFNLDNVRLRELKI